jgi:hypothetical protein
MMASELPAVRLEDKSELIYADKSAIPCESL